MGKNDTKKNIIQSRFKLEDPFFFYVILTQKNDNIPILNPTQSDIRNSGPNLEFILKIFELPTTNSNSSVQNTIIYKFF